MRYQPFFTDTDEPVDAADITHRRHAIIETVFAELIDEPLAHMPSGRFGVTSNLFGADLRTEQPLGERSTAE